MEKSWKFIIRFLWEPCLSMARILDCLHISGILFLVKHTLGIVCAPNGYSLRVVGVPQSRGTVQIVSTLSCLSGGPSPQSFLEASHATPHHGWQSTSSLRETESNSGPKPTLKPFYTHSLNTLIHQSNPLNPPHPHSPQPSHCLTHSHLSNPLCKTHPHTTEHLFNCTHLYTSRNILDLWMSSGRVVPLLARWKGRLAGLP